MDYFCIRVADFSAAAAVVVLEVDALFLFCMQGFLFFNGIIIILIIVFFFFKSTVVIFGGGDAYDHVYGFWTHTQQIINNTDLNITRCN